MPRLSASLSKEQYAWVESQSESNNESMAEVIRRLIDKERGVRDDAGGESRSGEGIDERIRELEERVDRLEDKVQPSRPEPRRDRGRGRGRSGGGEEPDVVEWLEENGPASKSEIVDACQPSSSRIKPDSWWRRHGRPHLKEAGAEFVRNVGWVLE